MESDMPEPLGAGEGRPELGADECVHDSAYDAGGGVGVEELYTDDGVHVTAYVAGGAVRP